MESGSWIVPLVGIYSCGLRECNTGASGRIEKVGDDPRIGECGLS